VHIRRSDYRGHVPAVYKNATEVGAQFYTNAFKWLKSQVSSPLIFIVVTDDMKWANDNLAVNTSDVFTPGKKQHSYQIYEQVPRTE